MRLGPVKRADTARRGQRPHFGREDAHKLFLACRPYGECLIRPRPPPGPARAARSAGHHVSLAQDDAALATLRGVREVEGLRRMRRRHELPRRPSVDFGSPSRSPPAYGASRPRQRHRRGASDATLMRRAQLHSRRRVWSWHFRVLLICQHADAEPTSRRHDSLVTARATLLYRSRSDTGRHESLGIGGQRPHTAAFIDRLGWAPAIGPLSARQRLPDEGPPGVRVRRPYGLVAASVRHAGETAEFARMIWLAMPLLAMPSFQSR